MTGARAGSRSTSSNRRRPGATALARGPSAKKRFGQHFLTDTSIVERIVDAADLAPGATVLEIGPGRGVLTAALARRAGRVIAVEIDRDLIAGLRERFSDARNVAIVQADALEHTPGELLEMGGAAAPYVVVANLPYNVAAPILRGFLEGDVRPDRLTVMVQLEVAESIVAEPGEMRLLSVATQVYAEARMVMRVPPGAFQPPPKVDSAVISLDVAAAPRVDAPLDVFFRIARAGFGNPRKQLRNSLSFGLHVKQEVVDEVMRAAGVDPTLRAQVLSLGDWAAIARAWVERTRAGSAP